MRPTPAASWSGRRNTRPERLPLPPLLETVSPEIGAIKLNRLRPIALENLLAKLAKFKVEFDQHFGADAALSPANLIDAKKFQLKTPDVTIQVNPERTDLVQTRIIGGVKYLLICADDGVEVNGIQVGLDE